VFCNTKFNKAGQEGTLSRPDRLNIIPAVSKRTRDQDIALTENAHGIPLGRSADTDNQTLIERENDANVFLFVFVVAASSQ
jgi:hypothetical protein